MRRAWLIALAVGCAACGASAPDPASVDFVVSVGSEAFVMRARDPETIRRALAEIDHSSGLFPIGPLQRGDAGFNAPWSWHLDPDAVRLTEVAIEVCDGTPSYVEAHIEDFPSYCPWSGRIVARR